MSTAIARRSKAISLIKAGKIGSQNDLVRELKKAGFSVTQTTASRDLEEIGAVRSRNSLARSMPIPGELIISVESSGNLAVVRTPPGGAQLLASSLDHSGIRSIIGTIAGDDTVLVVSRKASGGAELAKELRTYRGVKKGRR
jgi:transcriptional regulator of arginine metabolism